jgi:hypothetical protein
LVYKYNTVEQAKFYIEHQGVDFSDYEKENSVYLKSVETIEKCAEKYARVQKIDRSFVPSMLFGENDIVVAVGQDGLVANIMKYLDGQYLIGINPDVKRWDGVLLPFETGDFEGVLKKLLKGRCNTKQITFIKAQLNDGQSLYAVNDLFIGQKTHVSARYELNINGKIENQSSSGIIISTGLGSTGWYKSIITEAEKIGRAFGVNGITYKRIGWNDDLLMYTVREPYPGRFTQAEMVFGTINRKDNFTAISKMPENGVVFSDGMEDDFINFNSGAELRVKIADKKGVLVV